MNRRLLLDSDVVEDLERLPTRSRRALWKRLREIADAPDHLEDCRQRDAVGMGLSVHVFSGHAILFWDDLADRHLKILEIASADDAAT